MDRRITSSDDAAQQDLVSEIHGEIKILNSAFSLNEADQNFSCHVSHTPPVRVRTGGFQDPGPSNQGESSENNTVTEIYDNLCKVFDGSISYTVQTTIGSSPDPTSSTGSFVYDVETETPATFFQDRHGFGFDNSGDLSDILEVDDADVDDRVMSSQYKLSNTYCYKCNWADFSTHYYCIHISILGAGLY
ncbi:unnamed protein product [Lactuca saligna]|uniref:Uncharacterized protein n=1 Tax=Lactuca saligna TaxID=75948 RepID=A0AA35ZK72_LACSI|nr:unnamed protein product [Lactuca saligna]